MALAVVPSILQGQDRSSNGSNGHAQAKARLDRAEWHLRMPSNVDSAMACFRSAISIWSALGDQDHLDSATLWVGNALLGSGHSDSAEVVMNAFLADLIERKDTADQAGALSVLGLIYYGQSDFPRAIEAYDKAEGYARATGQLVSSGRNLNNLGLIYKEMSRFDQADELFVQAVIAYQEGGDTTASSIPWLNMAESAIEQDAYSRAEDLVRKGLACLTDSTRPRYARNASLLYTALGRLQVDRGETEKALRSTAEALRLAGKSGELGSVVYASIQRGGVHVVRAEYSEALRYGARARGIVQRSGMGLAVQRDVAYLFSQISERTGPPELALHDLRAYIRLKDSVAAGPTQWTLEKLAVRQHEQLDSLKAASIRQTMELSHAREMAVERSRRFWWVFALTFSVVVAVAIWLRWRAARRNERRLEELNRVILESQERLLESEKAREVEHVRTRIAGDVHDDIGSELTKITLLANEAKRRLGKDPEDTAMALDRIRSVSKELGAMLSDIVWAVDPRHDSVEGLMHQVRVLAQRMTDGTGIDLSLDLHGSGSDRVLDPATRRDLFLLLKEAMNNALKHADATRLDVRLQAGERAFDLSVKDNGRGFDPRTAERGNGLASMRARSARLSAELSYGRVSGGGTELRVTGRLA